jgi:hypothetical protein
MGLIEICKSLGERIDSSSPESVQVFERTAMRLSAPLLMHLGEEDDQLALLRVRPFTAQRERI